MKKIIITSLLCLLLIPSILAFNTFSIRGDSGTISWINDDYRINESDAKISLWYRSASDPRVEYEYLWDKPMKVFPKGRLSFSAQGTRNWYINGELTQPAFRFSGKYNFYEVYESYYYKYLTAQGSMTYWEKGMMPSRQYSEVAVLIDKSTNTAMIYDTRGMDFYIHSIKLK